MWSSFKIIVIISSIVGLTSYLYRNELNLILMRFFRDVGRYKSRRRLFGNDAALITILLGEEKPIRRRRKGSNPIIVDPTQNIDDDDDLPGITLSELARMTGEEGTPVYVGINGKVFDVTLNRKKYEPGQGYNVFVGRDATFYYGTGCASKWCIDRTENRIQHGEKLTPDEWKEVQKWEEFYMIHDQYTLVGKIVQDPVDEVLEQALLQEEEERGSVEYVYEYVEESSEVSDELINLHPDCEYWASIGECNNNPSYMIKKCSLACSKLSDSPSQ